MSEIELTLSSTSITFAHGTGVVTASVTNTGTDPQRVVLRAYDGQLRTPAETAPPAGKPAGKAQNKDHRPSQTPSGEQSDPADWAKIAEALRTIAPGATEQYTVEFTPDAPPMGGTYSIKLNAYLADEPPDGGSGQSLTLELIVPAEVKPEPKKKFPWWIIAAGAGLLVAIAVVAFILWPRTIAVPDMVNGTVAEAKLKLTSAKLAGILVPVPSAVTPNTVLSQDPVAGSKIDPESTVTINFSIKETVPIPSLEGRTLDDAKTLLTAANLSFTLEPVESAAAPDTVLGQDPQAGTVVELKSMVTVKFAVVRTVLVPDVSNQSIASAKSELERRGLRMSINSSFECDRPGQGCLVTNQYPEAGQKVPAGTIVIAFVRIGIIVDPSPELPENWCGRNFCPQEILEEFESLKFPVLKR